MFSAVRQRVDVAERLGRRDRALAPGDPLVVVTGEHPGVRLVGVGERELRPRGRASSSAIARRLASSASSLRPARISGMVRRASASAARAGRRARRVSSIASSARARSASSKPPVTLRLLRVRVSSSARSRRAARRRAGAPARTAPPPRGVRKAAAPVARRRGRARAPPRRRRPPRRDARGARDPAVGDRARAGSRACSARRRCGGDGLSTASRASSCRNATASASARSTPEREAGVELLELRRGDRLEQPQLGARRDHRDDLEQPARRRLRGARRARAPRRGPSRAARSPPAARISVT